MQALTVGKALGWGEGLVGPSVGYGRHPANQEARTPPHSSPGKVLRGSALHPGGIWQHSTCRQALKVSDLKPGKPRPHGPLRANKLLASSEQSKLDQISPPTHLGKNSDCLVEAWLQWLAFRGQGSPRKTTETFYSVPIAAGSRTQDY